MMDMEREWKIRRYTLQQAALEQYHADGVLIAGNANLFYYTGRVFTGYCYLPVQGEPVAFVRMPQNLTLADISVIPFHSPKQLPELLGQAGFSAPRVLMTELGSISAQEYLQLSSLFEAEWKDAGTLIRTLRSVKSACELELIRKTCILHARAYQEIPGLYCVGMTDTELSAEVELRLRRLGHLGLFRTYGIHMEAFMGSVLAGENAAVPASFDFALGGAGDRASYPMGPCGAVLEAGTTVMVDLSHNIGGYVSDISRTFSVGRLPKGAAEIHQVSLEIQKKLAAEARPGIVCKDLYFMAMEIVKERGLEDRFMGREQKAKFVGHGLGIEINEPPVLAPRCEIPLQAGMVLALEPKFVVDGVGAVGTENTYVVTESGLEKLTQLEEEILPLDGTL